MHKLDIEEFNNRERVTATQVRKSLQTLSEITIGRLILADDLTTEELGTISDLFPKWQVGLPVAINDIVSYQNNLYKCIQAHTTQGDWTPNSTPALWVHVQAPGVVPAWVQPTGAQDAYNIDDMVTHVGKTWKSTIDANTTVPGENLAFNYWVEV